MEVDMVTESKQITAVVVATRGIIFVIAIVGALSECGEVAAREP